MNKRQTLIATAVAVALWGSYQVAFAADATEAAPTTPSPDAGNPNSANATAGPEQVTKSELETVTITGVRQSTERAIEVKRLAPSIQDSISAENIGQLPDRTITDSLQRITGVQINRDAGVGTSVDVRGLPQVGTMLNGEVFMTPDQIDSQQPDFTTLPATLFSQVDVIKSPTSAQTETGISGALNLHTYRPWDLPSGFTYNYSLTGERGDATHKNGAEGAGLISYNGGRWGLQLSANYSSTTHNNANEGLDQYGVVLNPETGAASASPSGGYTGFIAPWTGVPSPPPQVRIFGTGCGSYCNVDVNGDGKSNGIFMGSQDISLYDITTERKRKAANASFQFDFGHGFTFTSDYIYGHQDQFDRNIGIQFNSTNWQGATYVPLQSRNTGSGTLGQYNTPQDPPLPAQDPAWAGQQIYTTQVYEKWPGDVESFSQITRWDSTAQNLNGQLDFNNGGAFKGSVRGIYETAHQSNIETDINISDSDGCLWADPNTGLPCGTFVYPAQLGGNRVFNPIGIPQNTIPITANFTGRNLAISLPPSLVSAFANPNGWTMKTLESSDNYDRRTSITALRFDGEYAFNKSIKLDFGVRNEIHTADNYGFTLVTPVYGGIGATNPDGTPNATGCLVRYVGSDVILAGNATDTTPNTWCTAGNSQGNFRAGPLSSQQLSKTPPPLANNFQQYSNLLGSGITFWGINPKAMDNPIAFWQSLYPNTTTQEAPGITWNVWMKELSSYLQADFAGELGDMSYSGNVGVRFIQTKLDITQTLSGDPGQYGTEPATTGTQLTERSYTDVLPALNFSLKMTDKLVMRLAASKNMMPLNLSQWGGGLTLGYSLLETPQGPIFAVSQGTSTGNPNLDPWRSTNYGVNFEYYMNPASMLALQFFYIDMQSFIISGSTKNCNLPDEDGVVRGRCVTITQPIQGAGNSISGVEFDYRQGFTFLPGLLRYTGLEVNYTYAPSNTGKRDLAGNKIPFQDNSTESGNLILWYQSNRFQARVAYNYRSKRAVSESVGGIAGMEMYEAPQKYLDASIAYKVSKYAELFVNGTNLTNEYQRYYLVWPDQAAHSTFSERLYQVGVRGQW
jgi:TonB-dependent receptor